ncbi:MAG: hypothetical protein ACOYVG_12075 [Bacteroidota bacterium]
MKNVRLLLFTMSSQFILLAQAQTNKGSLIINLGASSGYGYPTGLKSTENSGIPTLDFHAEYSLHKIFSFGPYIAYTYSFDQFDNPQVGYKDVWKGWDIGLRGTLHVGSIFLQNEKADLYITSFAGYITRALVYDRTNIYRDSLNYKTNDFGAGGIVGFHYFFNNRLGLYIETGISKEFFIGGGVAYKFQRITK